MTGKRGRKTNPDLLTEVEAFKQLAVGQSFFLAGKTAADMEYLRRPVKAAGVGITIRNVENDPVHKTSGVRIWRQHGKADEEL